MNRLLSVFASFLMLAMNVHCNSPTLRQTANGPVEGLEQMSSLNQKFYSFQGIPYAEVPITGTDPYTGEQVDRRFRAPEPLKRTWTNTLKAQSPANSCVTSSSYFAQDYNKTENCLFLNIYVPDGGAEKKTVLVFIHGGGFTEGSALFVAHGPDFLITEDNIIVTIHYRIGIFGFLNLGTNEYSGNMGLKDQQLALKWIYENIENFSGKKDEILLFGYSAGGASIALHLLNKESRKYFNRAYIASGSAFNSFALAKGNHMARMQECSATTDMDKVIEYMKTQSSDVLAECYFMGWGKMVEPKWCPTIEIPTAVRAFLTATPDEIYNSGDVAAIDTFFAFASKEPIFFSPELLTTTQPITEQIRNGSEYRLPFDDFNAKTNPEEFEQVMGKLEQAYFKNATDKNSILRENMNLAGDLIFRYAILKNLIFQIKANSKAQKKNTFLLRFDVNSEVNLNKLYHQIDYDGAAHADDYCITFHCHFLDPYKFYDAHLNRNDSASFRAIMRNTKIISNFAKTGNPSVDGDTPFKNCESPNEIFCQEFTIEPKTSVTTNIMEKLHYETWRYMDEMYNRIKSDKQIP